MEDNKRIFKFYGKPGEDFNLWAARTEGTLEAQEVLNVVTTDVSTENAGALHEDTKLKVAKARAIIMQGLDAKPLRVCLAERDNPARMWVRLQERYAVSNVATQVQLQMKLNRLRYSGQPMSDFIDSFDEIFLRLAGMGSGFPEPMQVALLLSSFGDKSQSPYGHVVAALQNAGIELTWENVTAKLLQEYDEKEWNKPESRTDTQRGDHALAWKANRNRKWSGKGRHFHENRMCYECHERKHIAKDCPSRKGKTKHLRFNLGSQHQAQASQASLLLAKTSQKAALFLLDSGASEHVLNDGCYFETLEEITPRTITLGDGHTVTATFMGTARLTTVMRGGGPPYKSSMKLLNVLLVPELSVNLLSCAALCADGASIRFMRKSCTVMMGGHFVIISRLTNGLYPVEVEEDRVVTAAVTINEELWHARLGHANKKSVKKLLESSAVQELKGQVDQRSKCPSFAKGKQARLPRHTNPVRAKSVGEVLHSDVCGPMSTSSFGGSRYYVSFIDEASGFIRIVPIEKKSAVARELKKCVRWLERRADCNVKVLQSDNGGEYIALDEYLDDVGIEGRRSSPYSPQKNGIAERTNRTIIESARAMLAHAGLPKTFWAEAVVHAADIRNRFFCPQREDVTSYELLFGRKPRVDHLRVFGCLVWIHIPKEKRRKLDEKSEEGILIGCRENSQYKVLLRRTQTAIFGRDGNIDESSFPAREWFGREDGVLLEGNGNDQKQDTALPQAGEQRVIMPTNQVPNEQAETPTAVENEEMDTTPPFEEAAPDQQDLDLVTYVPGATTQSGEQAAQYGVGADAGGHLPDSEGEQNRRYPQRRRTQTRFYSLGNANVATTSDWTEPQTFEEAMARADADQWREAVDSELQSLMMHDTWEVVTRPANKKVLPSRFVFVRKKNAEGVVCRYKARLVVKGYFQGHVDGTFAPVVDFSTVRVCLAMAVKKGLLVHHMDVKTAFLHGEIDADVFIIPPEGLDICGPNEALRLKKGLYGLKQSPRLWNEEWKRVMESLGYRALQADPCVFVKGDTWLLLYVDDILIMGISSERIDEAKKQLRDNFDVKDIGPLHHFLGVTFHRDGNAAWLAQKQYVSEVLTRFNMAECKSVVTPMCTGSVEPRDTASVDVRLYQEIIGSLLFIATRTRPDICAAVGILCRYSATPQRARLIAAKRVLRYLRGTMDYGLKLSSGDGDLVAFAHSDWGGDRTDRKSTSGILLQLGNSSILWKTNKQPVVALSTCEAEFVAASEACKDVLWIRYLLQELGFAQSGPTLMMQDNQGAQIWRTEGVRSAKHVAIRGNFVKQQVSSGIVCLQYTPTQKMTADILTKPLERTLFEQHRKRLGVADISQSKKGT